MSEFRSVSRVIRTRAVRAVRLACDDLASRSCLIALVASLWLTLTLGEPAFLAAVAASLFGLWLLDNRRRRALADRGESLNP